MLHLSKSMVRYAWFAIGLGCLLTLSPGKAFCQLPSPTSYLFVDVQDTDGRPVADANISVFGVDRTEINRHVFGSEGQISIRFPIRSDHHFTVVFSKDGYAPSEHVYFPFRNYDLNLSERFPPGRFGPPERVILRKLPATNSEREALAAAEQKNQLLLAVKRGDAATVRGLLRKRLDVNMVDAFGVPLVAWAALAGDAETIRALLAAGAQVRNKDSLAAKALLIYFAEGVSRDDAGRSVRGAGANEAEADQQREDTVRELIKAGADVNARDAQWRTVLNAALFQLTILSERIIETLIAAGANINAADESHGATPLMVAAGSGSAKIVRVLLAAGVLIDARDREDRTALMRAQIGSRYPGYNPEIVKALIAAGANVNLTDRYGNTALIDAANADRTESIKMLLAAGANVNAKDNRGETALINSFRSQYSSREDSTDHPSAETVKALLAAGANVHDAGANGEPLVFLVARTNSLEAVITLLNGGADVNSRDKKGQTAIMFDGLWGYRPKLEIFKALLAAKADVNAVAEDGRTPLMFASQDAPVEFVKLLLAAGAKVNTKDPSGQTALTRAVNRYDRTKIEIVKELLAAGADPNIVDQRGMTPLTIANASGDQELIRLFSGLNKP